MSYKKILLITGIAIVGFFFISSIFSRPDRTYSGRAIDADTKKPIEGAVVVVSWLKARATLAGDDTNFYDVKETLTDKEGRWTIEGHEGNCDKILHSTLKLIGISCIREPSFIVFKPGYCSWSSRSFGLDVCKKMKPGGKGGFLRGEDTELPKLTNKEDRIRVLPSCITGKNAIEKQKEFIRVINDESKNLGLEEVCY